jgi:predicted MPP superfamily phosphohydrolase
MPRPLRRALLDLAAAALVWLLLGLTLMQGNELWLPPAAQPLGHALYRLAYWLTLPGQWAGLWVRPVAHHHVPASDPLLAAALTALGLLGVWWGLCALHRRWSAWPASLPRPGRRELLLKLGLGAFGLGGLAVLGLGAWGVFVEPSRLLVRRYRIPIRGLPAWAEGLRIVLISDTHHGPYVSLPYLRRAVAMANSLQADVVALTGDYVHRTARAIPAGIGVLTGLKARFGRFAVLGNHDHWAGAEACRAALLAGGNHLLDYRHIYLGPDGPRDEPMEGALCLAGLGDLWEDERPPETAFAGVDPATPCIVLSHNPDCAEYLPEGVRVDLMLAGHTHGGQVYVPGKRTPRIPSRFGQWYAGGICKGPRCPVVVSRGVGMAYLPVRLGVRPEIVLVTLTRSPDQGEPDP